MAKKSEPVWDQIDSDLITTYINAATHGHNDGAKMLLHLFSKQLAEVGDVHPQILEFCSSAFIEILAGKDANSALHLTKPAHRLKKNDSRDLEIAISVLSRMNDPSIRTRERAAALVADLNLHGVNDEDQIKNIYTKNKREAAQQIKNRIVINWEKTGSKT